MRRTMNRVTATPRRYARGLLVCLGPFIGACGDGPTAPRECEQSVTVTVGSGTSPEISWTPECGALALRIQEVGDPTVPFGFMWELVGAASPIHPPVRYGDVPGGSIEVAPATPLVRGSTYRANVFRFEGHRATLAGAVTFTP